ncbi:hypothetical protein ABPG72_018150 [Tetrahymena utriculariae]
MAEEYDPEYRLSQMKKAIQEKAQFIQKNYENQAKEAYEQEFNKQIETEKTRITERMSSDRSKFIQEKKIEKSRLINEMRLSKMSKRYGFLENLKGDIRKELQNRLCNKEDQKKLLKNLILQAMIKLMEPETTLRCLRNDVAVIEGLIKECQTEFNQLVQKECKKIIDSKIKIDKDNFLDENLLGGIVLTCLNGNIVVSNTIDSRIDFAFQEMLPEIREGLYPDPTRAAHDSKRRQEQLAAQMAAAHKAH